MRTTFLCVYEEEEEEMAGCAPRTDNSGAQVHSTAAQKSPAPAHFPPLQRGDGEIWPFGLSSPRQKPFTVDDRKAGHHPLALIVRTDADEIQQASVPYISTHQSS
jgi:hypothetical protein